MFMRECKAEVGWKLRVLCGGSYVCCVEESRMLPQELLCVIWAELRVILRAHAVQLVAYGGVIKIRQDVGVYGGISWAGRRYVGRGAAQPGIRAREKSGVYGG